MDTELIITSEVVQARKATTVLHLRGWLDQRGEEKLVAAAGVAFEQGVRFLVLDLQAVEMMTSAGMRAIQKVQKIFAASGTEKKDAHLKICNAQPEIRHILGVTGFLESLPNYEGVEPAIASFGD
jgi:anti-anti-sigma factor